MLALSWVGEGYDWDATRVVIGFVIAGILLATFIPIELRAAEPIIPLSLFKSRVFGSAALLMFMVGIGMFGIILYTPLFVQGVLGKTATGSGTVLTPLVLSMTAMGVICGQLIARVKRIKPFMIVGAIVMTFGVYLLTTLDVDSTQRTVALYLMVTGLGLGPLMPSATLAVQSTVQKRLLGVATSSTQFIRSLGSTVGTAVIGSLVTSGYADYLNDNAPAVAPARLINALEDPNALVSDQARNALDRIASAFPGGEQLVDQIVHAARVGLSNSIHDGFMFTLVAVSFAIVAAILMKNIRLGDQGAGQGAAPAAVPESNRTGVDGDHARVPRQAHRGRQRRLSEPDLRRLQARPRSRGLGEGARRDRRRPDTQAHGAGSPRHQPRAQRLERSFGERFYSQRQRSAGGTQWRAGKEKLVMVKYVIGATGALLGALVGAWLMLAPFALAYQSSGADWADPTFVDFWTGLPLLVVSVVGVILYVSGLVEELRRRGIMRRPYAEPAGQPQAQGEPSAADSGSENNMEQVLLPLVTAMLKDMQERDRGRDETHQETPNNVQQARSAGEEGSVRS